jgi:hypothetical protein
LGADLLPISRGHLHFSLVCEVSHCEGVAEEKWDILLRGFSSQFGVPYLQVDQPRDVDTQDSVILLERGSCGAQQNFNISMLNSNCNQQTGGGMHL